MCIVYLQEVDRRKKYEDAYKNLLEQHNKQQQNASRLAGPDFEVSYCLLYNSLLK